MDISTETIKAVEDFLTRDIRKRDFKLYKKNKAAMPWMSDSDWEAADPKFIKYNRMIKLETQ